MGLFSSIAKIASPIIGGVLGSKSQSDSNQQNYESQKEFAQNSIRWKVEDAKAAGLHPLAALGAASTGFSPSFQSSNMGQSIARAVDATATAADRFSQSKINDLALERASLQNDLLRSQISAINRPMNPPFPSGSMSGDVQYNPSEITRSRRGDPATEAAPPAPAVKEFINADGSITRWPSADAKQSIEDSWYEYEHMYKNRLRPWVQDQAGQIKRAWRDVWWNPRNW